METKMSNKILLMEELAPEQANLVESVHGGKDCYLQGIMMESEVINGNGRKYKASDMLRVVNEGMEKIKKYGPILGELNHPETLHINPYQASHCIMEMRMDGNNVIGKMKLLNTPAGNITKAILEGGVRLGVSSRGTGTVDTTGTVSDFSFVTVDVVSQPSAPNAYPNLVREALETPKIMTLAEALVHDPKAQIYFKKEMQKFISSILEK
jgi:hypothetical protein